MNNKPFFTIGIPVYNTEKWVADCLDSILKQDFTDFEIICVDDGSTDNSLSILNSYAENDNRIKVIHKENSGVSCTRNVMHANAEGTYFYAIDSDDIMCENVLSAIYKEITENNYPDVIQTGCKKDFNGQLSECYYEYPGDEYFDSSLTKDERTVKLWLDAKFAPFGATRFIRRDIIWNNGLMFSPRYCAFEDNDFSLELYRKINTIHYSHVYSFVYMLRDTSVSYSFSKRYFHSTILYWNDFYSQIENWNISDNFRKAVEARRIDFIKQYRAYPLGTFNNRYTKEQVLCIAEIIENILGTQIKKLPVPKSKDGIIFMLYKIWGIKRTVSLLYSYLKVKGVVGNE